MTNASEYYEGNQFYEETQVKLINIINQQGESVRIIIKYNTNAPPGHLLICGLLASHQGNDYRAIWRNTISYSDFELMCDPKNLKLVDFADQKTDFSVELNPIIGIVKFNFKKVVFHDAPIACFR